MSSPRLLSRLSDLLQAELQQRGTKWPEDSMTFEQLMRGMPGVGETRGRKVVRDLIKKKKLRRIDGLSMSDSGKLIREVRYVML